MAQAPPNIAGRSASMGDVALPTLVLDADTPVRTAREQLDPGQLAVVVRAALKPARAGPVGVVAGEALASLLRGGLSEDSPLVATEATWLRPTVTRPTVPVVAAFQVMMRHPGVRCWYVVATPAQGAMAAAGGMEITGVVSPQALLHSALRYGLSTSRLADELAGDPIAPPSGLCYRCPNNPVKHWYPPAAVEQWDAYLRPRCPHDGAVMIGYLPCDWSGAAEPS